MEPQQIAPEQGAQSVTQESKKSNHLPIIIILAVLLVGSCIFGLVELYKGLQKDSEIAKLKETDTQSNGSTSSVGGEAISAKVAEGILEKYVGEGYTTRAFYLNAFYQTFVSDFDDQQKAFLAYSSIDDSDKNNVNCISEWYEKGLCTEKSISYDYMNEKYKSLFGDYSSIEKKNYVFQNFFYLVYDENIGAYREYILPGGGTTPVVAVHKVISVEKKNSDMIVSVSYAEIDFSRKLCGTNAPGCGDEETDEPIDEMVDTMAIYKFTLSPYGNSYVLTGVAKQ